MKTNKKLIIVLALIIGLGYDNAQGSVPQSLKNMFKRITLARPTAQALRPSHSPAFIAQKIPHQPKQKSLFSRVFTFLGLLGAAGAADRQQTHCNSPRKPGFFDKKAYKIWLRVSTPDGNGSCFLTRLPSGKTVIITNHHVVLGQTKVRLMPTMVTGLKGYKCHPANVLASNPDLDIAVLVPENPEEFRDFTKLTFSTEQPKTGETVISLAPHYAGLCDQQMAHFGRFKDNQGFSLILGDKELYVTTCDLTHGTSGCAVVRLPSPRDSILKRITGQHQQVGDIIGVNMGGIEGIPHIALVIPGHRVEEYLRTVDSQLSSSPLWMRRLDNALFEDGQRMG